MTLDAWIHLAVIACMAGSIGVSVRQYRLGTALRRQTETLTRHAAATVEAALTEMRARR